jgi:hypothetical protein
MTRSSIGAVTTTCASNARTTPQATRPAPAAARKLRGIAGGGTTAGTPLGRFNQTPEVDLAAVIAFSFVIDATVDAVPVDRSWTW